jgi:hypothetical protein
VYVRLINKGEEMKGPERMCAGQYQWHGFEIHRPEGDYVYWNVATIDGFWFGESGYLESHYTIESVNTYKEAKQLVADIVNHPEYGVHFKGDPSDPFNWSPLKDEDGNYIVVKEDL